MNITLEMIVVVVTAIGFLATAVERGVELFRPLWLKIKDAAWQNTAKIGAAIMLGCVAAFLVKLDPLAMLGFAYPPFAGYITAGLLASGGASGWHAILEWLKTIKQPDQPA